MVNPLRPVHRSGCYKLQVGHHRGLETPTRDRLQIESGVGVAVRGVGVAVVAKGRVGMAVISTAWVSAKAVEVALRACAVGVPDQAIGVGALRLQASDTITMHTKSHIRFICSLKQ